MPQSAKDSHVCDCQRQQFDCLGCIKPWVAGSQEALNPLVDKFQPIVQRIVQHKLKREREDEWDDCINTIWERLLSDGQRPPVGKEVDMPRSMSRLGQWLARDDRGWFCFWLYFVAAKRSIDWIRPRGWTDDLKHLEQLARNLARRDDSVADPIWDDIHREVKKTLATTTPAFQAFYHLYYEQGASLKDTSEQLAKHHGIAAPEIRKLRKELLQRLRHCFPQALQHSDSSKSVPLETIDPAHGSRTDSLDRLVSEEERKAVEEIKKTFSPAWKLIFRGRYQDHPQKKWPEILAEVNQLPKQRPISVRTLQNWHKEMQNKFKDCL